MSITKGAMLISNANAVGTELVNQLGGTGYKPVEWADAINLLGISNDDKASALAGITEGTYTGDERGSIKYSNCNAVGSMLNKKFSTDRGFKPVEWESAISKLTPLAEGTVSGSVVSFPNGADDVPTKSLVVTIPPTLTGVSEVSATQTGENLFDKTTVTDNTWIVVNDTTTESTVGFRTSDYIPVKANTRYYVSAKGSNRTAYYDRNKNGIAYFAFSGGASFNSLYDGYIRLTIKNDVNLDTFIVNEGNTAITYEPYKGTTYTASLGRTIYGAEVDIVNGKCDPTNWLDDTLANLEQGSINGSTGANENANNRVRNASAIPFPYDKIASSYSWTIPSGYKVAIRPYDKDGNFVQLPSWALAFITQLPTDLIGQGIAQMRFVLAKTDNSAITPSEMVEVGYILNKGNTAKAYSPYFAPFTFDGQEIPTRLGYNAFWSDEGDTEVTYRKDPDIPDPPVQLLNMNNENNENNENNDN